MKAWPRGGPSLVYAVRVNRHEDFGGSQLHIEWPIRRGYVFNR